MKRVILVGLVLFLCSLPTVGSGCVTNDPEWHFGEWHLGRFTAEPGTRTSEDGESYITLTTNGLPSVGAILDLAGRDLSAFSAIVLDVEGVDGMELAVELIHNDETWPEGAQHAAYTRIAIQPQRTRHVLPLPAFAIAAEDFAGCAHCRADFVYEDADLLVIYINSGAGELRVYDVLFEGIEPGSPTSDRSSLGIAFALDRFDDGDLTSEMGSTWAEYVWNGGSLSSPLRIEQETGSRYLVLDATGPGGVGVESEFGQLDLSGYDGIYLTLHAAAGADLGVALRSTDGDWPSEYRETYVSRRVHPTDAPTTVGIPFKDFAVEEWRTEACPDCAVDLDPCRISHLGIETLQLEGELRIYEIGVYAGANPGPPDLAVPGVDGYAVILEANDHPDDWSDVMVDYIHRDRIIEQLTTFGWSEEDMYIALDHDVTRETVEDALAWLGRRITSEDIVLFYITAHGLYLDRVVDLDSLLPARWAQLPTERKLLVVDACFAGRFTRPAMYRESIPPEGTAGTTVDAVPGVSLGACAYDEVSWGGVEEEGLPIIGSVLSYYFCETLADSSLDSDDDGYVSVEEAFPSIYERTRAYMRDVVFQVPDFLDLLLDSFPDADPGDYPHPELIDAYEGGLVLDLSYYAEHDH